MVIILDVFLGAGVGGGGGITVEIDTPKKQLSTDTKRRLTMIFSRCQFQLLLSKTSIIHIISHKK